MAERNAHVHPIFRDILNSMSAPCRHEWKPRGDFDLGGDRTEVVCRLCAVPGERDDATGEVYWPAS